MHLGGTAFISRINTTAETWWNKYDLFSVCKSFTS